jgi:hypothetical protein
MLVVPLFALGLVAVVIGAVVRPFVGHWIDARNVAELRRHYGLDEETAEHLYRLARREGFGSAWVTIESGRRANVRRQADDRRVARRNADRRQVADRRFAARNSAGPRPTS